MALPPALFLLLYALTSHNILSLDRNTLRRRYADIMRMDYPHLYIKHQT